MELKIVIHFGFPKTGSSTLQFGVLKKQYKLKNLNFKTWRLYDDSESLDKRPSSRLFNRKNICDYYLDFNSHQINILSDESLTAPLRLRRQNYGNEIEDPFNFPRMLKEQIDFKYPKEKIEYKCMLTIRNQAKLIYSQYVEEYAWKKYKNIDLLFNDKGDIDVTGYEIYNFSKYIENIMDVFGEDSVNVTLFEDWINDFDFFCGKLSDGFCIDKNEIKKLLKSSYFNIKNKTTKGVYSKDGKTLVPYLTTSQEKEIISRFYKSNEKLAGLIGMKCKLKKYGYIE